MTDSKLETLKISSEVKDKLYNMKERGESYSQVILRLFDSIEGNIIVLEWIKNQHGKIVPKHWFELNPDFIHEYQIKCLSSEAAELGTCACVNHTGISDNLYNIVDTQ